MRSDHANWPNFATRVHDIALIGEERRSMEKALKNLVKEAE